MSKFQTYETAWCPGCGNFGILQSLKTALEELNKDPYKVLMMAGIGQAAKTPQYISANSFCGLHGRALPAAIAAKIANEDLTVIVDSGDGDTYGEGGNHFLHNIRRNVNITHFVHDNQIYGLTKGQASPTSGLGQVTSVQVTGSINEPMNPVLMAIAGGAGFVARAFSGDTKQLTEIMKQAIEYDGYALVDILMPCVSFNKVNSFAYYKKHAYHLEEDYDPTDKGAALLRAMQFGEEGIPTGVLYREEKDSFHKKHPNLADKGPLLDRKVDKNVIMKFMNDLV